MAISVRDIQEKEFATQATGGYNIEQVDDFLDEISEQLAALVRENLELGQKVQALQADVKAVEAKVPDYNEKDYFDSHLSGKVYTEGKKYNLSVVGFAAVNVANADFYNVERYKDDSVSAYIAMAPSFKYASGVQVKAGDKLMMLSTCDTDARYMRDVLLVKLEETK
jgi:DivIVA domain-containing protein